MTLKMASKSEIVRLSHRQLAKLAQKYGQNEKEAEQGHQPQGRRSEERDRQRKSKRPDRQIYQPGRTRLRRRNDDDDPDLYTGGEQEEEVLSNREGSTEKELDIQSLTQTLAQVNVLNTESSSAGDSRSKRRQKRPDQQIYVPKPRQMCQGGDEEQERLEEGEGDPGGGLPDVHAAFLSPISTRRTVDIPPLLSPSPQRKPPNSADNMVVTVVNSSDGGSDIHADSGSGTFHSGKRGPPSGSSQSRGRSSSSGQRDRAFDKINSDVLDHYRESSQSQKHPKLKGVSSGRSPVSQDRRRHASGGSDFELNWSDVSHDSLEWDYQVEIEFGGSMNLPGDEEEGEEEDIEMEEECEEVASSSGVRQSMGHVHVDQVQGQDIPGSKKTKRRRERKPRNRRGKSGDELQAGQGVNPGEKQVESDHQSKPPAGEQTDQGNRHDKGNKKKGQKDRQNMNAAEIEPQAMARQRKDSDHIKDRSAFNSSDSRQKPLRQNQLKDSNSNMKQKGRELKNQKVKHEKNEICERGAWQNKGRERNSSVDNQEEIQEMDSFPHLEKDLEKKGGKKLNLTVTFAKNERQVKMMSDRESSSEEREFRRGLADPVLKTSRTQPAKVGGILHLPPSQPVKQVPSQDLGGAPGHPQHSGKIKGGSVASKGRGRGGSHRTLYDPNNPSKSVPVPNSPAQLQFYDPHESQYSPDSYSQGHPGDYHHDYGYDYRSSVAPRGYYEISYSDQPYSGSPRGQTDGFYSYGYPSSYHESGTYADDTYSRDPYYHSGYEAELPGNRSRSATKQKAEALLRDVAPLESQLGNLLSRRIHGEEGMQKILALRRDVQMKFEQVILMDPDLANCHNVEQTLWKSGFYQVIEVLRRHLADNADSDSAPTKEHLLALLEEGTAFYEGLLKNLQNSFAFQLDDFLDPNALPPENLTRSVKLALLSAQRTLICLGDIARYREQANHTTNYGKARSWYMKAQQIAPKNGRPYNQLAILALYTRRKLDAVYYYMRSLAASNPFITARESLMSLFDEARRKAEVTERKRHLEHEKTLTLERQRSEDGTRVEIWISTDGTSSHDWQGDSDDDELKKLSTIELNKRFILSFLNVHGKLFTKIGMETFPEVSSQMLQEFSALLQHTPSPIGNVRLLQLMTINMFAIENTLPSESTVEEGCRSLVLEQAVGLGLEMFGLLTKRCTELLKRHLASKDCQVLSEDLHQLMPSVKVWSDWMMCHACLWNPPPLMRDPSLGPQIDVWRSIADLCNVLKQVDITYVKLYALRKEGCDAVVLGEDSMLAGFVPLLSLPQIPMYVHSTVDKEIARDCLRVEKLRTFGDYLCGIEPPLLSYNVETHQYVSIAPGSLEEESPELRNQSLESAEGDDVIVESEEEEEASGSSSGEEGNEIEALKARKAELQRKKEHQDRLARNVQNVLNHSNQTRPITLEIRPQFLVPDTNCFIDHLALVRHLLVAKKYTIVIPLTVINELDGLAKGSREGQYDTREHAEMVKSNSQQAIDFVEAEFEGRNSHLRALTSMGTVMDTIAFRSEDTTQQGNNDDMILSCCLHYCKDKARDFMPKDNESTIRLLREVVLLTDDRNLRLKAHMRNVPVKDIQAFLKWAKVS